MTSRRGPRDPRHAGRRDNLIESGPAAPPDLLEVLAGTWQAVCERYDAIAEMPELGRLFQGAQVGAPSRVAEEVLARMLVEVSEAIPRYSRDYIQPIGVRLVREAGTGRIRWALRPGTRAQWQSSLQPLAAAIRSNVGLILAADLLDGLEPDGAPDGCMLAACQCLPARAILIRRGIRFAREIICPACGQPFRSLDDSNPARPGGRPD